jgi:hypothetical protein
MTRVAIPRIESEYSTDNEELGLADYLGFKTSARPTRIEAGHDVIEALISANAELTDAVADLVDNSIDAGATLIEIRLHKLGSTVVDGNLRLALSIWDNGEGMSNQSLKDAIALSRGGLKDSSRLGKFGVGLKASSFSNSAETTIFTRVNGGQIAGMQLSGGPNDRMYAPISEIEKGSGFSRSGAAVPEAGTIVRWEHLKGISKFHDQKEVNAWLSAKTQLLAKHLGLVFHRFIKTDHHPNGVVINLRQMDENLGEGLVKVVRPLDPGKINGNPLERVDLTVSFGAKELTLSFYTSPKGTVDEDLQQLTQSKNGSGFYFYRNSRVIQTGGWRSLLAQGNRDWRLCRLTLELPTEFEKSGDFNVSHDKNSCTFSDELRDSIVGALDQQSGKKLSDYLRMAEQLQKTRGVIGPSKPALSLARGLYEENLDPLIRELCTISATPIEISLLPFPDDSKQIFHLDVQHRKLTINSKIGLLEMQAQKFAVTALYIGLRGYLNRTSLTPELQNELSVWNQILWNQTFEGE